MRGEEWRLAETLAASITVHGNRFHMDLEKFRGRERELRSRRRSTRRSSAVGGDTRPLREAAWILHDNNEAALRVSDGLDIPPQALLVRPIGRSVCGCDASRAEVLGPEPAVHGSP